MNKEILPAELQFDIDGVVCNLAPVVLPIVNQMAAHYGEAPVFTARHITSFNWIKEVCMGWGMSEQEATRAQFVWGDPEVVEQGVPYKGAVPGLRLLHRLYDGKINFSTSRRPQTYQKTITWFETHLPFIDPERIYQKGEDDRRSGKEFKADNLIRAGAMRHYEDEAETAHFLGRKSAVVVDRPYNREPRLRSFDRVRGWNAVLLKELGHVARRINQ